MLKTITSLFMVKNLDDVKRDNSFTFDFQMLCALITHLGAHEKWQSRPPSEIAGSLAMDIKVVDRVLCSYPCFFRESGNRKNGEKLFTVHLRYARRKRDQKTGTHVSEPMTPDEIGILTNILIQMVSLEKQESQFVTEMRENNKKHIIGISVAIAISLISALATLIAAISK